MTPEKLNERRNSIVMTCHYPDLGSFLIGWKFASFKQKHYPDLGSGKSEVWNLCTNFSYVISRGKPVLVVSRNVGCFLTLAKVMKIAIYLVYLRIIERTF